MSILIVDDSQDIRLQLTTLLREAGHAQVLTASSAGEAFKVLDIDHPHDVVQVDLILMDITMPELDGIDACRRIKAEPRLQDIPIIMVTGHEETSYLNEAYGAGAIDYITKPVRKDQLLVRVNSGLALKREIDARKLAYHRLEEQNWELEAALSERNRLEAELAQAQRMQTIGQLAGGIAHDFNNLLTVITNYAYMGALKISEGDPLRDHFLEIQKAGERASSLTNQLMSFSRHQPIEPKPIDVDAAILSSLKMLRRLVNEDIELVHLPEAGLGLINIDPTRLEQLLVNLTVNAGDAMPEGGKLSFETFSSYLNEEEAAKRIGLKPGRHLVLRVKDNGVGMSEDVRSRVFEPFLTTKEVGKGTGLGLFTCYGIVNQCGGYVEVDSIVGHGTTFTIYLPEIVDAPSVEESFQTAAPDDFGSSNQATVLIVEDEPAVRNLTAMMLREWAYSVLEAGNGDEALNLVKAHTRGDIDLVLTDMVMPIMGGREFVDRLKISHPAIPVIFYSGYTDYAAIRNSEEASHIFLQKPFTAAALSESVKEALARE